MPILDDENSIRKAAVLIRSLDSEAATAVLTRLSSEEARALRHAVRELGEVSDEERKSVASELANRPASMRATKIETRGGVELEIQSSPPPSSWQPSTHEATYERSAVPAAANSSLDVLGDADAATLVEYLQNESLQTVAVVLSCLSASQASEVLANLPIDRQVAALDLLAELGDADPQSLTVITSGLRDWIIDQQRRRVRRTQRLGAIRAILAAAPDDERQRVLAAASDRAWRQEIPNRTAVDVEGRSRLDERALPEEPSSEEQPDTEVPLAEEVTDPSEAAQFVEEEPTAEPQLLVSYAEVERFPVSALAQVMRHAPADHLLLALAGSSEQLVHRLAAALPRRQAASLRSRVNRIAPVRLREIEQAQESIAHVASELVRRGWINVTNTAR